MAVKSSDPIDILLEMGIDLDNLSEEEDYLSALKEAIAIILVKTKGAGDEKSKVLLDEVIKVRKSRKAADPKFKAKNTTIKPDAFFDQKKPEDQAQPVPGQKALPGTVGSGAIVKSKQVEPPAKKKEEKDTKLLPGGDPLKDILKGVNSIIGILKSQQKLSAKQAEKDRKRAEKQKRSGQEDKLEKGGIKSFISGVGKILKPVKGLLSGIFDFIKNILIGAVLIKILDWFTDEKNKKKIDALGNFFKNTWPLLLAAYLLFGNSIGRFAVTLIKAVVGFTAKLIATIIPALVGAVKRFGIGKSAKLLSVVGGTAMLLSSLSDGGKDDVDMTKSGDETKPADVKDGADGKDAPTPAVAKPETKQTPAKMKGGGIVPGSGPNKDTVPAMLAPGEFVMSRGAVSKYGAGTMASMNAAGGGTNLPKRMNGVTHAVGGGLMGDMSSYGYGDDKKEEPSAKVQNEMEKRAESKPESETDGGFLSGITGGIKSLFGGGGDDKEKGREGESEEKSSSSTLSETQQKALQVLAKYESGAAGYDAVNQIGTKGGRGVEGFSGDIKKMPQHEGRSLTDFTLGEIKELQHDDKSMSNSQWIKAGKLHAVGAYQFIGNTLPEVAARAGIPDSAKFSPAVQDLMALQLIKERGISPWVGPSDKATAAERAIVEKARSEPIAYDKTSGGGAITAFGGGGGQYTSPGQSGSPSGGSASGGSSKPVASYDELVANFRSSGGSPGKSMSKPSGGSPPGPPVSAFQAVQTGFGGPGGGTGSSSGSGGKQSSGNSSNAMTSSGNTFPDIDANAAISTDKIKVLGLTLA